MTDPTVRNLLPSIVRTIVPILVGAIISGAAHAGFDVDRTMLSPLVDAVVMGAYYTAVRWAEERWPQVGLLLGWRATPTYDSR